LAPVRITGRVPANAAVAGWGDVPLAEAPVSATRIDGRQMREASAQTLADLVRFDASTSDAYNSEGYIGYLTVRGFLLDNRFNYRRDGLPINAETSIPLDNKAWVDILKGTSGIASGTSAPGGMVDYVVKRPLPAPLTSAFVEWKQPGNALGALDLSRRFGGSDGNAFGVRLNAAAQRLEGFGDGSRGNRNLLALAGDWRLGDSTLLEGEVETSHRAQPSQAAFSLLGDRVPEVSSPHTSLNNQPWTKPVVFDGTTYSLRATEKLGPEWQLVAHAAQQRLKTDDREAFPFGCSASDGTYYADRFCPDGTFDLYDFRSEGEHRRQSAVDLRAEGRAVTGSFTHDLAFGALRSWVKNTFHDYAYNFAGTGTIDGKTTVPPAPDAVFANTNRDERSTELYARDRIRLGAWTAWLGVRRTRLERSAVDTQGNGATSYAQSFTAPFGALSWAPAAEQLLYASWGRGIESDVAPVLPMYANAGQALPAAKSTQVEAGWKGSTSAWDWELAVFDIRRPSWRDVGACDGSGASCTRMLEGTQRHRGADASLDWRRGEWSARVGAQWLHARIEGTGDPALDGTRPPNVPERSLLVGLAWSSAALPGLAVQATARYEGPREVLPDNSIRIGSWTTADLGARYERRVAGVAWTARLGVNNVFDREAWRESPYQFSHAYLFPLAPRTWRMSLQVDL
jgi:iron complex outermembrane receptor protein